MIRVEHLTYTYMPGTPLEARALEDINLEIDDGEFIGLVGRTGSGKSTLVQHFNALLFPTKGKVYIDGIDTKANKSELKNIRRKVGLVFQYPEHQLFEETVYKDIAFGPHNLGIDEDRLEELIGEVMELVDLNYSAFKDRSPFELSGGEKRRVALAGVLAMKPRTLILDEPTAGLDPRGKDEILDQIDRFHSEVGMTIILISHDMEEIARRVERIIVLDEGQIILEGDPKGIFAQEDKLTEIGLELPPIVELMRRLKERGIDVRDDILSVEEARGEILRILEGRKESLPSAPLCLK